MTVRGTADLTHANRNVRENRDRTLTGWSERADEKVREKVSEREKSENDCFLMHAIHPCFFISFAIQALVES